MMTRSDSHRPKDSHYARLRRAHRARSDAGEPAPVSHQHAAGRVHLYGLHSVREAIANPRRHIHGLKITRNAAQRLVPGPLDALPFPAVIVEPRELDRILGAGAVHQGVLLEADALQTCRLSELGATPLVLVLDQVTDPHNVGAILRSAVAFGAGALVTTARHSPRESGVLAKAASGALEHIDLIEVGNLAKALKELAEAGFATIGLDSQAGETLEGLATMQRIALVLGAEGKGLREKTRAKVRHLARLDLPGPIRSLNVSNAAAISLHIARSRLIAPNQRQEGLPATFPA